MTHAIATLLVVLYIAIEFEFRTHSIDSPYFICLHRRLHECEFTMPSELRCVDSELKRECKKRVMIIRNYTKKKPIKSGWIRVRIKRRATRLELGRARLRERRAANENPAHTIQTLCLSVEQQESFEQNSCKHTLHPINGAHSRSTLTRILENSAANYTQTMHRIYLHEYSDSGYGDCLGRQKSSHTHHAHCTRTLNTCARVRLMQAISN